MPTALRELSWARALRSELRPIALILLIGLLFRLLCVALIFILHFQYPDEGSYWDMAGRLLQGKGLSLPIDGFDGLIHANSPTAYFGTFAVFVAPLRFLIGDHLSAARAVVALISWPALALAVNSYVRPIVPWLAPRQILLLILAVHPDLIFLQSVVMSEAMFIPLVSIILLLGPRAPISNRCSMVLGAAYGLSVLIRPDLIAFLPIHLMIVFLRRPTRLIVIRAVVILITATAVVSPWLVRNQLLFHRFMLESKSGFNLALMNNSGDDKPIWSEDFLGAIVPPVSPGDEGQMDLEFRRVGIQYIRQHPKTYLRLCVSRFLNAYGLTPTYLKLPRPMMAAFGLFNACFYLITFVGGWVCVRKKLAGEAVALILYAAVVQSLTDASFRHRSYADAAMGIVAVAGLARWWASAKTRTEPSYPSTP